jgi:acetoin:2,6-dichlorophenolindophenol oxidoreductase subunit alpha
MTLDLWQLYREMLRSRRFEEAVSHLWSQGLISGEMHLGIGEEAIAAGTVCQLEDGDALALDHRGTPPLVMRGVGLVPLLREFLGCDDGLCHGCGGHMHLFAPDHLAVSSGIVGAAAPAAVGLALSAQHLRPGRIALAFFGEGATNQGMVMEALNLAVVWHVPVVFVCKDNNWSITTYSSDMSGGSLLERARSFGMPALDVDGRDVEAVWQAACEAISGGRKDGGPTFLLAHCDHLEGHFLGDPLLHLARQPVRGFLPYLRPLMRAVLARRGTSLRQRIAAQLEILRLLRCMRRDHLGSIRDPLERTRSKLSGDPERLERIECEVTHEIEAAVRAAREDMAERT